MRFIDQLSLSLKSGQGGAGCISFASDSKNRRAGPDGGNGGRGGHVIIQTNRHLNTLFHLSGRTLLSASNGGGGRSQNRTGASGKDLVVEVPPGTVVLGPSQEMIVDLVEGEHLLIEGGRGGKGNTHFKNSVRQAPSYCQPGELGKELRVQLELKLIADVGLIGLPNAGKSTLMSALTAARPRVGDYPFTTLQPQLGVVERPGGNSFCLADTPGLIPGASQGLGLGHRFLRHIERTRVFVHLLDVSDLAQRDVWQDYIQLNEELNSYDFESQWGSTSLSQRKQLVVFNKIDVSTEERLNGIRRVFSDEKISFMEISAVAQNHLEALKNEMAKWI